MNLSCTFAYDCKCSWVFRLIESPKAGIEKESIYLSAIQGNWSSGEEDPAGHCNCPCCEGGLWRKAKVPQYIELSIFLYRSLCLYLYRSLCLSPYLSLSFSPCSSIVLCRSFIFLSVFLYLSHHCSLCPSPHLSLCISFHHRVVLDRVCIPSLAPHKTIAVRVLNLVLGAMGDLSRSYWEQRLPSLMRDRFAGLQPEEEEEKEEEEEEGGERRKKKRKKKVSGDL